MEKNNGLLSIGDLQVAPGHIKKGWLNVEGLDNHYLPLMVLNGKYPGSGLAVTGGVHAAEVAGIEGVTRFMRSIDPKKVSGFIVAVPIVNFAGFFKYQPYISPLDGRNINRIFPGAPDGTPSEKIAHTILSKVVSRADAYVDLHGGDLVESLIPFSIFHTTGQVSLDCEARQMAEAYDLDYVVRSNVLGSAYAHAAMIGKPAIIAEVGQQGICDHDSVSRHVAGLFNVLRHLGMYPGPVEKAHESKLLEKFEWVCADTDGTYHPCVKAGDVVSQGQEIGELHDYFGDTVKTLYAPIDGVVLFLLTSLAAPKGHPLIAVGA